MTLIRPARAEDATEIHAVVERAFGRPNEADLVDALIHNGKAVLSLVAASQAHIIGHILFSPITIESEQQAIPALALAPVAVHPDHQNHGIGSQLIRAGLDACRHTDHDKVIVLGHPAYYPRFGFEPASQHGIRCEFPVPEEAFMALALKPFALAHCAGIVRYPAEFHAV